MNNIIYGATTTTPIPMSSGATNIDNCASAIQNTISGGEKSLTVNDVSPLAHKCSCRLTSDTYESVVGGSNNIYDFNSENIEIGNYSNEPASAEIQENGTIICNGHTENEYLNISIYLRNLVLGKTYTISLRNSKGKFYRPNIFIYNDVNGGQIGQVTPAYNATSYTFTHTDENVYEYFFDYYYYTPELIDITETLYPQLEFGTEVTDWAEYSSSVIVEKPYIEDFSTVTVTADGKTYTPSADGTVTDIVSVSPTMEITTDNEYANIVDFTYCVDTKAYIEGKTTDNSALGDIETALDNIIAIQENLIGGDDQ